MKSWKTTTFGAVTALGIYLKTAAGPEWLHTIGTVLELSGPALLGYFSRDNNVTSEQAQAGEVSAAILGLCVALAPLAVQLLTLWLKKKNDPVQQKLAAKQSVDEALAAGDVDAVNRMVDDKLRELASRQAARGG